MIAKVQRGADPAGLIRYLFSPGRSNEHTDQHVIAHWTGRTDQVTTTPGGGFDLTNLIADLRTDLAAAGILGTKGSVWHTSVSLPASDGTLTDAQWAEVAQALITEAGLEDERPGAVRWVAVRHGASVAGNDHIHLVAALAATTPTGQPVSRVHLRRDYAAVRRVCNRLEVAWNLTRTAPATGAAHQLPQRPELEIAARTARRTPQRLHLERAVRSAAIASHGPAEFTARLAAEGITARFTRPAQRPGTWLGVTYATTDYTDRAGNPIRFSGRKLARDLTAGALQNRWDRAAHSHGVAITGTTGQLITHLADHLAAAAIPAPVPTLRGHIRAGADALWAGAEACEHDRFGPWHTAAGEAARAAREPGDIDPDAGTDLHPITHALATRPRARTKAEAEMARAHELFRRLLVVWATHDTGEAARIAAVTARRMSELAPPSTSRTGIPGHGHSLTAVPAASRRAG